MKKTPLALAIMAAALLAAAPAARAQNENQGHGRATVTILPKQEKAPPTNISPHQIQVHANGDAAHLTGWDAVGRNQGPVELVLLINADARSSIGTEWNDITHFVRTLPPNVKFGIAYMEYGRSVFPAPLTSDRDKALQELHLPNGLPGSSASTYFCLSDLAKNWPSHDASARREVVMITDGVDNYERRYNPEDPYVMAAINDSLRARLVVYAIYWHSVGRFNSTGYETNAGQNLLEEVTQSTGGNLYWIGFGNPVSLQPYFQDLDRRLSNQYELALTSRLRGKPEIQTLKVKVDAKDVKVIAPQQISVTPSPE